MPKINPNVLGSIFSSLYLCPNLAKRYLSPNLAKRFWWFGFRGNLSDMEQFLDPEMKWGRDVVFPKALFNTQFPLSSFLFKGFIHVQYLHFGWFKHDFWHSFKVTVSLLPFKPGLSKIPIRLPTLFVFSIGDPKQNINAFMTPLSDSVFYALLLGSLSFAFHGSFFNHSLIGQNSSTANKNLCNGGW